LDFHLIAYNHGAALGDFAPGAAIFLGEPEAIATHHRSILQNDPVAQVTIFADHGVRMREAALSQTRLGVNNDVGKQRGARADNRSGSDDDVSSYVHILADRCAGIDHRGGVYSRRILRRRMKDINGQRKRKIGVCGPQCGRPNRLKFFAYQNRSCLGGAGKRDIFRVGHKGQLAGAGFLDPFNPGNFLVRVAVARSAQDTGQFSKFHEGDCIEVIAASSAV